MNDLSHPASHAPSLSAMLIPERLLKLAGIGGFVFQISPAPQVALSCGALELLGLSEEDAGLRDAGGFIERCVAASDRSRLGAAIEQLVQDGGQLTIRYQVNRRDSSVREVRSVAVREIDAAGNVRVVGTIQDATHEQREEEDLRRMQERLTQVAHASLLGEMSSGISHELNQPLAAMATFAYAATRLLERPEPQIAKVRDLLRDISAEALRAGDIIRHMRLITASTAELTRIDLREVFSELRKQFDPAIRAGVHLQIDEPPQLPLVLAERSQLHHVIASLLQNAIEACRAARSDPAVRVEVRPLDREVEVAVEDNGPGVAPEAVPHLFRPFFTTKTHGTGLGLASSRSIIEAHHGHMGYCASAGGGARFFFRLPIETAEASAD